MTTLTVELPDGAFSALRLSPAEFSAELRLAAAVNWYESGKISQEVAAEIAGLCRTDFLLALARLGKNSFHVDLAALDRELARG
jgi:predicted HTH domain antitoxin